MGVRGVCRTERVGIEVRTGRERGGIGDFGAEGGYAEVVAPDLTARRAGEKLGFEGGLAVDACPGRVSGV